MDYKAIIANELSKIFKAEYNWDKSPEELISWVEMPKNPKMGDHAVPCFPLAKEFKKAPPQIAAKIAELLNQNPLSEFSKIEAAGPYLNFTVNKADLSGEIVGGIFSGEFLHARESKNLKVMVEYSQPNTHKAFHVGHTRNLALGDALVKLYEWSGYEVVAANYIGDVGAHISRCLWFFVEHYLPEQEDLPYPNLDAIVDDISGLKAEIEIHAKNRNQNLAEFLGEMYSSATELLDFKTLSEFPFPGLVTAKVLLIEDHPSNKDWKKVQLEVGNETFTVVCGGSAYTKDDIVAYAPIGSRAAGRLVKETDKAGVTSFGMILSEKELGLTDLKEKIFVFDAAAATAQQISEVGRKANVDADDSINEIISSRLASVSRVLKELEKKDSNYHKLWQETREWSMENFLEIYDWFGARFDHFFFESDVGDSGKKLVKEYLAKDVFVEDEGAIGVRLEEEKLPFFMVLKSDGTGLYSTKDLALAEKKFKEFGIDKSIYVVDVAQSLHFQQVFASLRKMGFPQANNCFHLAYGMVVLPDGKMSSRKGNVILFSELKEALEKQIYTDYLQKYDELWSKEETAEAIRKISLATIRYGMINQDNNKNIIFNLTDWTAKSGNTGPYMMYAYARTRSIISEVKSKGLEIDYTKIDYSQLSHEAEGDLVRKMSLFHEAAAKAIDKNEAQSLCIYLFELSKDFNRMYASCSVAKAETPELMLARTALVDACGRLIRQGLSMLGIETLERM